MISDREAKEIKFHEIPNLPGVYILKDEKGTVLYVGKAKDLANRLSYYFQKKVDSPRIEQLKRRIKKIEIYVTENEYEALELEADLVAGFEPKYNVELKDDKHYPYIKITQEEYPRVVVVRERKEDGGVYFGPFTDVGSMRRTLKVARALFGIRDCKLKLPSKNAKPCLNLQIKRCLGPCVNKTTKEEYKRAVENMKRFLSGKKRALLAQLRREMRKRAKEEKFEEAAVIRDKIITLERFFGQKPIEMPDFIDRDFVSIAFRKNEGVAVIFQAREGSIAGRNVQIFTPGSEEEPQKIYKGVILQYYRKNPNIPQEIVVPIQIEDEEIIEKWFLTMHNKKCRIVRARSGAKLKFMQFALRNAELILNERIAQKAGLKTPHELLILQKELNLKEPPARIEAFDISNIQGKWASGSLVVFVDGKPKKSEYRRFRIVNLQAADDYSMIKEVVYRRYRRVLEEEKKLPDLILIDGGQGQLISAIEALNMLGLENEVPVASLAKRLEEIYLPGSSSPITIPRYSLALKLLQKIRDEAHRFALSYHKKLRERSIEASILKQVPGIGDVYQKRLLSSFRSIEEIAKSTPEEISKRTKINLKVAEKLLQFLTQNKLVFYL